MLSAWGWYIGPYRSFSVGAGGRPLLGHLVRKRLPNPPVAKIKDKKGAHLLPISNPVSLPVNVDISSLAMGGVGEGQTMETSIEEKDGMRELNSMGKSWFTSYAFYDYVDKSQVKWKNTSTIKRRKSYYERTRQLHRKMLQYVLDANPASLAKNSLGLSAADVKEMARKLLRVVNQPFDLLPITL